MALTWWSKTQHIPIFKSVIPPWGPWASWGRMLLGVKQAMKVFPLLFFFLGGGMSVWRMCSFRESPGGVSLLVGALWSDFLGLSFQKWLFSLSDILSDQWRCSIYSPRELLLGDVLLPVLWDRRRIFSAQKIVILRKRKYVWGKNTAYIWEQCSVLEKEKLDLRKLPGLSK